jgi:hypothetical protein
LRAERLHASVQDPAEHEVAQRPAMPPAMNARSRSADRRKSRRRSGALPYSRRGRSQFRQAARSAAPVPTGRGCFRRVVPERGEHRARTRSTSSVRSHQSRISPAS